MRKFLAVVKREYVQRVRSRMFIVVTILAPMILSLFGLVPAFIFSIKAGGPTHIAVIDQTGKIFQLLERELNEIESEPARMPTDVRTREVQEVMAQLKDFRLEEVSLTGRTLEEMKRELDQRLRAGELDGYLVLPPNLLGDGRAEFYATHTGDLFMKGEIEDALSTTVREQRLVEANIDVNVLRALSRPVDLQALKIGDAGSQSDSGEGFALVFAAGFVMYITLLMYGQVILGAVIEEKETRIAEILFSSIKPLTLMVGKLTGVSLVALTQLVIWGLILAGFLLFGVGALAAQGYSLQPPNIPFTHYIYFTLFFLLGYFIYSTLYVLVGSVVTTAQEGGQLAMPIVLLLVVGFYLAYPVLRSPGSSFAFWVSMFPFFAPIAMLVRIVTETPPFWQIALSLAIGFGSFVLITWIAARIYRVGMLMYGKKASIPEIWRWVRTT